MTLFFAILAVFGYCLLLSAGWGIVLLIRRFYRARHVFHSQARSAFAYQVVKSKTAPTAATVKAEHKKL